MLAVMLCKVNNWRIVLFRNDLRSTQSLHFGDWSCLPMYSSLMEALQLLFCLKQNSIFEVRCPIRWASHTTEWMTHIHMLIATVFYVSPPMSGDTTTLFPSVDMCQLPGKAVAFLSHPLPRLAHVYLDKFFFLCDTSGPCYGCQLMNVKWRDAACLCCFLHQQCKQYISSTANSNKPDA